MKLEDYSKYYIQGSDHYLIPKEVFLELFNEMTNWKEESKELRKKIATYEEPEDMTLMMMWATEKVKDENKELKKQQEFIKYLEDCIKELEKENLNKLQNVLNLGISDITKEILQKYKEIKRRNNDY